MKARLIVENRMERLSELKSEIVASHDLDEKLPVTTSRCDFDDSSTLGNHGCSVVAVPCLHGALTRSSAYRSTAMHCGRISKRVWSTRGGLANLQVQV